jgi:hypothetical protein
VSKELLVDGPAAAAEESPPPSVAVTLDLDAAGSPPRPVHLGLPWGTVVALLALCAAAAGFPEPRLLPAWSDVAVSVAPAVEPWDGPAQPLGAARIAVRVQNTGATELEVGSVRVLQVGTQTTGARATPAMLSPGESSRMLVDVLPDCRFVPPDAAGGLLVQVAVRGPGGGRTLRLLATADAPPLVSVCPDRTPGWAITATGHQPVGDAGAAVVRLVNTGTQPAVIARSLDAPEGLQTVPQLPRRLDVGEAKLVLLQLAPGTCVTSPESLLQVHWRYGHAHIGGMDAVVGSLMRGEHAACPDLRDGGAQR